MNVAEVGGSSEALDKFIVRQKLDRLRIASGVGWQNRFALPEQIPVTLVIDGGRVRVMHDSVMADPVSFLEADLSAIHRMKSEAEINAARR